RRAASHDRRLRPPPDRRATRGLPRRDRGVRRRVAGGLARDRRFEGDHLAAGGVFGAWTAAQELDPACDHLERRAALAVLLPGARLEPPVDRNAPSLAQVLGAQLRLAVPGR